LEAHPIEKEIGIETYITPFPGIGGKLRTYVADFVVEEINTQGEIIPLLQKNDFTLKDRTEKHYTLNLVLEKHNLETFNVLYRLASFLQIPLKNIGFAGLKDKRAITSQQISISHVTYEILRKFKQDRIFLNRLSFGKPIKLGNLNGNHFQIIIRQMSGSLSTIQQNFNRIKDFIFQSGIPNYYGPQRFGAIRPISHIIGRALLLNDYKQAIKIYLTNVYPQEAEDIKAIRTSIKETWPEVHLHFPPPYFYENHLITQLKKDSTNFKRIFKKVFPQRYFTLFIHAFQSYIFNKLLSARIQAKLPLVQAIEGDFVALLDEYSLPTQVVYIVNSKNIRSLNDAITKNQASVMAPLCGFDLDISKYPLKEEFEHILEEADVDLNIFKASAKNPFQFKTRYRPITLIPHNFQIKWDHSIELENEAPLLTLTFSLNKGTYATTLLREFMKTTPLNY